MFTAVNIYRETKSSFPVELNPSPNPVYLQRRRYSQMLKFDSESL